MRRLSGSSCMHALLLGALVSSSLLAQPAPGSADEQRRLQLGANMPLDVQRAPVNQAFLVSFVRRSALLYLHRLDTLSCRALFGMGDESRFAAAIGSTDGSEHNVVYVRTDSSPHHWPDGPYVFPSNTWEKYWPGSAHQNVYWHEVQHDLLDRAGVTLEPAPYRAQMDKADDTDDQHALIEGVGQRGTVAYFELLAFEDAVRRADRLEQQWIGQGLNPGDYGLQRQAWGEAHQRFSSFFKFMKLMINVPEASRAAYRAATGVWFSSTEKVAEFYRSGGLKRSERGEVLPIRVPAWVFYPDLLLMPVRLQFLDANKRDLEEAGALAKAPSETKNDVFKQSVQVVVAGRGAMSRMTGTPTQNVAVGGWVKHGHLRIKVVEDEPLVGLAVSQGKSAAIDGIIVPGGPSTRFFDIDLSKPDAQPTRITFVRRKLSLLKKAATYHVSFEFADPVAGQLYDDASAQLSFTIGAGGPSTAAPAAPQAASAPPAAPAAPTAAAPGGGDARVLGSAAEIAARRPNGITMTWATLPSGMTAFRGSMYDHDNAPPLPSAHSMELNSGPSVWFKEGDLKAPQWFITEVYSRTRTQNFTSLQNYIDETDPPGSRKYGRSFEHREIRVAGYRTFESMMTKWDERGGQRHVAIEVDPQRHIYIWILSDQHWFSQKDPNGPIYLDHYARFIKSVQFAVASAPPLALSRDAAKPVPKPLTDDPIEDNEIEKRPPPPPPPAGGGGGRRRPTATPGAAATTTPSAPSAPGAPVTGAATAAAAATGASTAGATTTSANTATAGATGATTTATGGRAASAPPKNAPPVTPAATAADASGTLNGRGSLELNGGSPLVTLSNDSRGHWTRCTITVPGRRSLVIGTLPAQTARDYPIKDFKTDANAPALTVDGQVQCAEGKLGIPANLSSVSPDSLAAAIAKSAQEGTAAATNAAKRAAEGVKNALGGLFRKKP